MQAKNVGWFILISLFTWGCGSDTELETSGLSSQIAAQVWQSCDKGQKYHKSVWDLDEENPTTEDSIYSPVPKIVVGEKEDGTDSLHYLLLRDLEYGIFMDARHSSLEEKLVLKDAGDTLLATVLPEFATSTPLQEQKQVIDAKTGTITYLSTRSSISSWLYKMDRDIEVFFDKNGNYLRHIAFVNTRVPLLKREFKVRVEGSSISR